VENSNEACAIHGGRMEAEEEAEEGKREEEETFKRCHLP